MTLYIISFFTALINESLTNEPQKVLSSFQSKIPYFLKSLSMETDQCTICNLGYGRGNTFFSHNQTLQMFILTPLFLVRYIYPKEYMKGSIYVLTYFFVNSILLLKFISFIDCCYQLVVCVFSLPIMIVSPSIF